MKLCISKIKDEQLSEQEKKEFLEELGHWAEELDLAKDFFTIGGLDILEPLLDHPNEVFVTQTCSLIANLVQNNDHCQRIIVQSGLQQKLLQIVDQSSNPDVKTKAVTAISGSSESTHSVILYGRSLLCFSSHSGLHPRSASIAEISRCQSLDSGVIHTFSTSTEQTLLSDQYHLFVQCTNEK